MKKIKWFTFVIPALCFYILFFWVPFLSGIFYSFTDWNGVTANFTGFQNYIRLFQDPQIISSFGNSVFYTAAITVLQNILGLLLALLVKKNCFKNSVTRTLLFMPYIFSSLAIGYIFRFIFEPNMGALNSFLELLHLEALKQPWLSEPFLARCVIVFVTVWQCCGYTMIINVAGLQGIPVEYYEAANLDGASRWQQFKTITFPLLASATTVNIVLCLIGNLQIYNQIFAITGGGPGYETESVAMTVYRLGFGTGGSRWGYGAAMSVVMFAIIMILTVIVTSILRKREVEA